MNAKCSCMLALAIDVPAKADIKLVSLNCCELLSKGSFYSLVVHKCLSLSDSALCTASLKEKKGYELGACAPVEFYV